MFFFFFFLVGRGTDANDDLIVNIYSFHSYTKMIYYVFRERGG